MRQDLLPTCAKFSCDSYSSVVLFLYMNKFPHNHGRYKYVHLDNLLLKAQKEAYLYTGV